MANLPDNDDFDSPIKSTTARTTTDKPELTVIESAKSAATKPRKRSQHSAKNPSSTACATVVETKKPLHKTTAYLTAEQWIHLHDEIHRLRLQGLDSLRANQRTVISAALDYYFARKQ